MREAIYILSGGHRGSSSSSSSSSSSPRIFTQTGRTSVSSAFIQSFFLRSAVFITDSNGQHRGVSAIEYEVLRVFCPVGCLSAPWRAHVCFRSFCSSKVTSIRFIHKKVSHACMTTSPLVRKSADGPKVVGSDRGPRSFGEGIAERSFRGVRSR